MIDDDLRTLGRYLARRDIDELGRKVDLLVLMGSAVLESVEVTASAFHQKVTERILISGGIGHSTRYLIEAIELRGLGQVDTAGRPESHIFRDLLIGRGVSPAAIEVEDRSTNCGENAEFSRQLVQTATSLLLIQDPTMQRRTHASFERAFPGTELISFAPVIPDGWSGRRFVSLVLGEIRRLHDTPEGYGPRGANHIGHVDVPPHVLLAYRNVAAEHPELVRPPGG
ncbi:YdcF family protein [Kribbella qitaiheensis]|uniref:YdcF family protein n=1 Tax=Kribbella qitaiheensis TaxID=1544730 RepID=A0A7G6X5F2_9ACTN|nr:YdcF family protein [Kribbella qitaiheensis]QNE21467.1 YdcF family protein [Kribbella qitaiheensis]